MAAVGAGDSLAREEANGGLHLLEHLGWEIAAMLDDIAAIDRRHRSAADHA
jgi:hypothetical protein